MTRLLALLLGALFVFGIVLGFWTNTFGYLVSVGALVTALVSVFVG